MTATRLFSENVHYVAVVEDQQVVLGTKSQQPQLLLTVKLTGAARRKEDVELKAGSDDLPESLQLTRSLYFDLDPAGPKLKKVLAELKSLGYNSTDPRRLHPSHNKHVSFVGKSVLVRVWYREDAMDATKERDKWFLVTPRNVDALDFAAFNTACEANADAYVNAAGGEE